MAQDNKEARAAGIISVGSAITSALALLNSRKTSAVPPEGELVLPEEFVQLIIAIAASSDKIDAGITQVIDELSSLAINVQGWPPNAKYVRTFTIICAAVATPYRANTMAIPSGMNLVIKSHPINAIGSLIQVASTAAECLNINSSYPLVPNESIAYALQNSEEIFVSSNAAGSIVVFTAEKEL